MKVMEMIDITFAKRTFIYFVFGHNDEVLYIGWTDDLNKKSFNFKFDYKRIAGFYYDYPDIDDEVDRLCMQHKPVHNKSFRSLVKLNAGKEYINKELDHHGIKRITLPRFKKYIDELGLETQFINGENYISKFNCDILIEHLIG